MTPCRAAAVLAAFVLALMPRAAAAGGFPSPEQAMSEAFPGARLERKSWALSEADAARVESLAGSRAASRLVTGYLAFAGDALLGIGILDGHVVRTKPQALLVAMTPGLEVVRVEVLAFAEPRDYLAPERWLRQLDGQRLDGELELKRAIRGITGATLTARATTAATRRALAQAQVLRERGAIPAAAVAAASAPR